VILGDDQPPAGRRGRLGQRGTVDGLDGVQVDDPRRDPSAARSSAAQALVHGDARPDQGDLVARPARNTLLPPTGKDSPAG
jgi:hypothetical protein